MRTPDEELVRCLRCGEVISEDYFVEHAIFSHVDDVLSLIDDVDVIESLSEGIEART